MTRIKVLKENKEILNNFLKADAEKLFFDTVDSRSYSDENGEGYSFGLKAVQYYFKKELNCIIPKNKIIKALKPIQKDNKNFVLYKVVDKLNLI